jgi:hypothetical protein
MIASTTRRRTFRKFSKKGRPEYILNTSELIDVKARLAMLENRAESTGRTANVRRCDARLATGRRMTGTAEARKRYELPTLKRRD